MDFLSPLKFIAGALLSTPQNGLIEYDGICFFGTPGNANRGLIASENFIYQQANRNLGNNLLLQQIFDATTNGTLELEAGVYFFEALLYLTSMSTTSGNAQLDWKGAGDAVFASALWQAIGFDNATGTFAGAVTTIHTSAASGTNVLTASANAALAVSCRGSFKLSTGGTIIPSIKLQTAAAAVLNAGSFFKCRKVGDASVGVVGKWT